MNFLLYFDDRETESARQYGKRLRDEGHRCQFRNGQTFKYEPIPEIGKPEFDTILVSQLVVAVADVYRRWFVDPLCKYKGTVEVIDLDPVVAPQTPVDEAVAEQNKPTVSGEDTPALPPLPTERVNYLEMPWHTLQKEVGKLTGTSPKNKKEAMAVLGELKLL